MTVVTSGVHRLCCQIFRARTSWCLHHVAGCQMLSNLKRMLAFKILKRPPQLASFRNCSGASKTAAPETVEKVEEKLTLVQKWKKYWKTVYSDYRDVALDVAKDIREKPVKSVFLFSLAGLLYYVVHNKPSERDFRDFFLRFAPRFILYSLSYVQKQTASQVAVVWSLQMQRI